MALTRGRGGPPRDIVSALNAVDMTFVLDGTASMSPWLAQARRVMTDVAAGVAAGPSRPSLRLGLVVYRDHERTLLGGMRFRSPVDVSQFVDDPGRFKRMLGSVRLIGGRDVPEAVADGVAAALQMPWRPQAQKAVVLIGDAPPHGAGARGDDFPQGCPCGLDVNVAAGAGAERGIVLHAVAVSRDRHTIRAMQGAAEAGGGEFSTLTDTRRLATVLIGLAVAETRKVATDIAVADHYEQAGGDLAAIARASGVAEVDVRDSVERLRAKDAVQGIARPGPTPPA